MRPLGFGLLSAGYPNETGFRRLPSIHLQQRCIISHRFHGQFIESYASLLSLEALAHCTETAGQMSARPG
jgi:hypothetical protein